MENKQSYFSVFFEQLNNLNEVQHDQLSNDMDLVIAGMNSRYNQYRFVRNDDNELVYLFKTETRKRKGQLIRLLQRNLHQDLPFHVNDYTKDAFDSQVFKLSRNSNFTTKEKPDLLNGYNGSDIEFLNNKKNWYPWQFQFYDMVFHSDGSFKEPNPRQIISIIDKQGNQGKSVFLKMITARNIRSVGRLGYASASQLKSSIVKAGRKDLYIVDLARSKSRSDSQADLLAVLEDLKSGLVCNPMFGSGEVLLSTPPHIVVISNYELDYQALSADRWLVFKLKNKKLTKVKIRVAKS